MLAPRSFNLFQRVFGLNRRRFALLCALVFVLLSASDLSGQQPAQTQTAKGLHLGKVEVVGLERFTQEQVLTASGLTLGQPIDIPAVDEAADRLMNSGLFKKLSYRYRSTGNLVTVTFQVEEAKEAFPVVFENFVWFSNEELTEAIRRAVPSFDGTAPQTGEMPERIKKALQALLNERKIEGHVEYLLAADLDGKNPEHLFSVKGIRIPICSVLFPGARDVKESELIVKAGPLISQDYAFKDVKAFAKVNLLPLYRQRGHLRANFLEPTVKPQSDADCQNGVTVSIPVDEGYAYTWDKAVWSGNNVLAAESLSAALGMKSGERADGLKIDKGLAGVAAAYGKQGYLEAHAVGEPEFDDSNRRVSYRYHVTEGPQYRMGTLEIKGLPPGFTEKLQQSWQLQAGEVFDTSYYEKFLKKAAMDFAANGLSVSESAASFKPNRDNLLVNVLIEFK